MELKRIIAATDFSVCGNYAVRRTAVLASCARAQLKVVHVLPSSTLLESVLELDSEQSRRLRHNAEMALEDLVAQVEEEHEIKIVRELLVGSAHRMIEETVEVFGPDLLVVGAHGEGMLQQFFLGGTAGKVLSRSARPMLVVRGQSQGAYRSVLAAVDLGKRSATVVRWARMVAPTADCCALHAFRAPFEGRLRLYGIAEESIKHYVEQARAAAEREITLLLNDEQGVARGIMRKIIHGDPTSVILDASRTDQSDLVVVGRHSGSRFDEALMGSVAKFIAFNAQCDVMVV